jgi:hypothetical protein
MRGQWRLRSADWAVLFAGVVAEEDIGQEQDTAGVSRFHEGFGCLCRKMRWRIAFGPLSQAASA